MVDQLNSVGVALGLALLVAVLVAGVAGRLFRAALGFAAGGPEPGSSTPDRRRPVRVVRILVFVVTLAVVARPAFTMLGVPFDYGVSLDRVTGWLFAEGLRIGLIGVLAYFAIRLTKLAIERVESTVGGRTGKSGERLEFDERLRTIGGLAANAVTILVVGAALLMVLKELGLDITPLLTAAGIGGLAVGFGAQNLVRDVISGFFLILEDQIHVGNIVSVNGTSGVVENVRLRTIVLRDLHGTVHVIPNGTITMLSNMTKGFAYAVLDVGVAYTADTDQVVDVLREVGAELQADPSFAGVLRSPLEILGVDALADSAVVIRVRIKTAPAQQWAVGRELRRRVKKVFDARGIEIPFPHVSITLDESTAARLTQLTAPVSGLASPAPSPTPPGDASRPAARDG